MEEEISEDWWEIEQTAMCPEGGGDVYLLDSTLIYLADAQGQWQLSERDLYQYTAKGWEILHLNALRDVQNATWINNRRYSFFYDAKGLLIRRIREDWDGVQWNRRYRYDNTYNNRGLRSSSVRWRWDGFQWVLNVRYLYSYDLKDRLRQRIRQRWNGTQWVNTTQYVYTYDPQGYRIRNDVYRWDRRAKIWVLDYKYEYINDNEGNVLVRTRYLLTGGRWQEESRVEYFYDIHGNRTQWIKYVKVGVQWKVHSRKDYFWRFFNAAPTDIELSDSLFYEGDPQGTVVGVFHATDVDDNAHTFTLIEGDGTNDRDNGRFRISGNSLLLDGNTTSLDGPFYIFVRADDGRGGMYCKAFRIYKCKAFTISYQIEQISCHGTCDGSIAITEVQNATNPVRYVWNTGDTTPEISNLCPGQYSLTITDKIGCVQEGCYRCEDGRVEAEVRGGVGPYRYKWSNGDTTGTVDSLAPGRYVVTVEDSHGCVVVDTAVVDSFVCPEVVLGLQVEDVRCWGSCDGRAEVEVGGMWTSRYRWSRGDTTRVLEDACAGTYGGLLSM